MGNKYHIGIALGAFTLVMMLLSSPATAVPASDYLFNTNITLNQTPSLEFAHLVAGRDSAVYAQVSVFGGEGSLPVSGGDGLDETSVWLLLYTNQANFPSYLNRAPSDFPDGLVLFLSYPASVGVLDSLGYAAAAAGIFETKYSVSFDLLFSSALNGRPKVYAFYSGENVFSSVAADTAGIHNAGFSTLMQANLVTSAPVGWAGYGVRSYDSRKVGMYGMGWVDPNGISQSGAFYTHLMQLVLQQED
jgi:hypothetical protein